MITSSPVKNSHLIFENIPEVLKFSEALEQDSEVKFLGYAKLYDDGTDSNLLTTEEWCKHYLDHYLKPANSHCRLIPGINYWCSNPRYFGLNISRYMGNKAS